MLKKKFFLNLHSYDKPKLSIKCIQLLRLILSDFADNLLLSKIILKHESELQFILIENVKLIRLRLTRLPAINQINSI